VIVGSNGLVAWGFTNTTADWTDLVIVETAGEGGDRYRTPDGMRPVVHTTERIKVRGGAEEALDVRETIWGPIVGLDERGRPRAVRWVPHDAEGLNSRFSGIETARSVEEAFSAGRRAGIPAQNLVVASHDGRIGWTIAGRIPRRVGFTGRVPVSWADGSRRWDGWLAPSEYPLLVDPPSGLIVTANNRLVDGEALAVVGDGGYDQGARARQIRNALATRDRATIEDMLAVQLDDRALFLARWRDLALEALTPRTLAASEARREFRDLLETTWTGRASVDSVAYRLVRTFRTRTAELAFAPLIAPVRERDAAFPPTLARAYEGPLWRLLREKPAHLLDPRFASWQALLVEAIDQTIASLTEGPRALRDRTWGEVNTTRIAHPLSRALPWLGRWLDMPVHSLPGDAHMPRVQGPDFGASQRLAVSPGREHEGYFHMPGGQSGHPLSAHYRDGHGAWARGEPTPLLPGPAVHRLALKP
jgi:penicillin amidase